MPVDYVVVFAPLIGALLAGLFQRFIGDRAAMLLTTALMAVAAGAALYVFATVALGAESDRVTSVLRWVNVGAFQAHWSIRIDTLSAVMLVVVTSVSTLVHLYSIGYMAEDPHRARFFSYLSLFTFMMLMLVTANDFLQLFFGWEGVGLASYLLIGFWYKKKSANDAAIKAFVVNRVGDFGFALGIFAIFAAYGSIEFDAVFKAALANPALTFDAGLFVVPAVEAAAVLLFIGAMGKSAQFFLHVWLPDAMEGPTPVSALIHAATMVTAGVFLVCRCSALFELAPNAAALVTIVGGVTALYAATVGLAQNDIKRVIAYSTCSQLGYMFFAAGVGVYQAAMFHLFTHAFFKALLFLGAGSVIHGLHHEQDMRRMGGIWRAMPITWALMLIGTLAITGVGIPGTHIGFAGFFSKDAIIESAYAAGAAGNGFGFFAFWIGVGAALLTSFYSWRLMFMTFHGTYKGGGHDHANHSADDHAADTSDDHAHAGSTEHGAHESPIVMLVPLVLLAIGAVAAGFAFLDSFFYHHQSDFWAGAIYTAPGNEVIELAHKVPLWVKWAPFVVTLTGFIAAIYFYLLNEGLGARIAARRGPIHTFLEKKWMFDELYNAIFVRGARGLGDVLWKVGDQRIIDGGGPDGVASSVKSSARLFSRLQSGFMYHYAFVMLLSVAAFGAYALMATTGGK
jgi:NADH-quinone oxidoreductase subunit L